jgi:predicted transcriptional regulator
MQQNRQINLEDIQRERLLHVSIVEKCDLITNLFLEREDLRRHLNQLKKDADVTAGE